jgi:uncharacterized protein (DUF608 family)
MKQNMYIKYTHQNLAAISVTITNLKNFQTTRFITNIVCTCKNTNITQKTRRDKVHTCEDTTIVHTCDNVRDKIGNCCIMSIEHQRQPETLVTNYMVKTTNN